MASNYTEKETNKMIDIYTENPCLEVVSKLSIMFNRPKKSIISKLVKEGVYIRKRYLSKTGETPITKLQVVRTIEDALDVKLPELDKAPKVTLKILAESIIDQATLLEDALDELRDISEVQNVKEEILKK